MLLNNNLSMAKLKREITNKSMVFTNEMIKEQRDSMMEKKPRIISGLNKLKLS